MSLFGNDFFYNGVLRKHIIMFGNMFNDIYVKRYDSAGVEKQSIKVPIAYGPKEKFLVRLNADPSLSKEFAMSLPALSFEMTDISYDSTRTLNKTIRNTAIGSSPDTLRSQFTPIPYNINISLYGMFDGNEDAIQVVEQIVPYFRPEWTHSMKLIPSMGEYYDVPTQLNDLSIEDAYEADFQTRRAIIYTFNFTVKGYLFGPVSNKGVIKRTVLDFTIPSANASMTTTDEGPQKKVIITPGLLANGSPTSNSSASVAANTISSNSNYGIAIDSFDYFDGVERHNH